MMEKRGKKIGMMFFGICLLTGCAKTPEVKKGEDISKAVRKDSVIVENLKQSQNEDLSQYDFITKSDSGYLCRVSLGDEAGKLNIEAAVENAGEEEIPILEAKANITDWNPDQIKESFFAGKDNVEDITVMAEKEYATEESGEGQVQIMSFMPSSHFLKLRSQDNTQLEVKDTYLDYSNDELIEKRREEKRETEKDISKDFTIDMAWNEVAERFREAGLGDVKKESAFAVYYEGGGAEYDISFTAMVNGLPLVTSQGSITANELSTTGFAAVTQEGIAEIQSENSFWEIQSKKDEPVLNIGQLVKLLEQYVAEGRIRCCDKAVFRKCELCYFLSTTDWKTATLTPVWRLYIPLEEIMEDKALRGASFPYDIVIDAATGEILRMQ